MKTRALILSLFCTVFCSASNIDSLIAKARSSKDTNTTILLNKIARELLYIDPTRALAYADSSEILARRLKYPRGICRAYVTKGIYYRNKGDFEKGFIYQSEAIKMADKIGDKKIMAGAYTNLGILFKNQGNYKKSIGYLKESKKKYTELGDRQGIANCYLNMSNTYRRDKQPQLAIECGNESLKLFEAEHDSRGVVSAYSTLGAVYMEDVKDYQKALLYYLKVKEYAENEKDLNARAVAYQNLGTCYYLMKNHKLAISFTVKSLELSHQLGNADQAADNYLTLAEIQESTGNIKEALDNYKQFHQLKDSLAKQRYKQSTLELEEKFHSEKSQKEIDLLSNLNDLKTKENKAQKNEIKKNKIIIVNAIFFSIIIGCLAFLFYKNFKKTKKLNELLVNKNVQIESQKKEILDSIAYARRIQDSILPRSESLSSLLPNHFIIYKPRDIVSGDFYWATRGVQNKNIVYVAMCDCTGHGVPGAFMSMIGYTLLNQTINDPQTTTVDQVLNYIARELPVTLKSEGHSGDLHDGLDIAVIAIDGVNLTLECSMAHIPVYICDGRQLKSLNPDKQSISADNYNANFKFSRQKVALKKGDRIFVSTDGFADQFGGPKGKKLKYKELEKLLLETHVLPLHEQKQKLDSFFESWKANLEQVDDVTLMGIEV